MVINKKIILKKHLRYSNCNYFFKSQIISTVFSIDRHTSIFGYYGRFLTVVYFPAYMLYRALIMVLSQIVINIEKLLKWIVTSSLLFVILWAIPGQFGHDLTCLLFTGQFNNSCWDNTFWLLGQNYELFHIRPAKLARSLFSCSIFYWDLFLYKKTQRSEVNSNYKLIKFVF